MTHIARGSGGRRIPKAWLLPMLAVVALLISVYAGLLSRSILLDFLAWWPVWLLLLIASILARGRRWGRVRLSGVLPIVWVLALGLFTAGHVIGWPVMPSASIRLVGPSSDAGSNVALSARIDGVLEVGSGESGFLYAVEPVRRGGDIGIAEAVEQVQGTNISVQLQPVADPGLYTFAGWMVDLHETPLWNLALGGSIEAGLERLRLAGLQVSGEGRVRLGAAAGSVVVNVSGVFEIAVPSGVPVRVVGEATVPDGWLLDEEGAASPVSGEGWIISVGEGSSLSVTEG